jgi:hypothetical protein
MSFKLMNTILVAALLTTLMACAGGPFKVQAPSAHVEWIVGIDVTSSIKPEQFNTFQTIIRDAVLARLRSGDRVHVLLINSDPQTSVRTFTLDGGKTGVGGKAAEIYSYIQSVKQPVGYRGTTNIASFLSYVKEVVNRTHQEEASLQSKGKAPARGAHYVALLLSDGKPEGKQLVLSGEWPADVPVWALGIDQKYMSVFQQLCVKQMHVPEANMHVFSFATWETGIKNFGLDIDRPQNQALRDELVTGRKPEARL